MTSYLSRLAERLRSGLAAVARAFRRRQAEYLRGVQNADGGFAGRRGPSDVYYTVFALRAADMLDVRAADFWRHAAAFVRKNSTEPSDVTDCVSLLAARDLLARHRQTLWCETCAPERIDTVRATLERFRLPLGGFARAAGGEISLYHTFLAGLCFELLGESTPDGEATGALARSRQLSDGGFADLGRVERSGTNQTAAALGVLRLVGALGESGAAAAAGYLVEMQRPDGGFAAHAEAPMSDLMSTFTALETLVHLGRIRDVRLSDVGRYVKSLAAPGGGFAATTGDDAIDVEYTYYGLGTLALLAAQVAGGRAARPSPSRKTGTRGGPGTREK